MAERKVRISDTQKKKEKDRVLNRTMQKKRSDMGMTSWNDTVVWKDNGINSRTKKTGRVTGGGF